MNDPKFPDCPKCGFPSLITNEEVERPDGSKIKVKICQEKNCSTTWVEHHEKGYFIIHVSKHRLYGERVIGDSK